MCQAVALLYFFKSFELERKFVRSMDTGKILLSGLLMFVVVQTLNSLAWNVFVQVIGGVFVYVFVTWMFGVLKYSDLEGVLQKMFGNVFKLK